MANNRVIYACEAVGFSPFPGTATWTAARGVQTVGMNTRFNMENVFELGQLAIYEFAEDLPDVEFTAEKVLDGYCPLYLLATQNAPSANLFSRAGQRHSIALSVFDERVTLAANTSNQIRQCTMTGMYIGQVGYNINLSGPSTESISSVGNNKVWTTGSFTFNGMTTGNGFSSTSPSAAEGVNRREDLLMASCLFPLDLPGTVSTGINPQVTGDGGNAQYAASIQSIQVSASFGRDPILELGRREPYFRPISPTVEVTTAIEVVDKDGDNVSATEAGIYSGGRNTRDGIMYLQMREGLRLDMGDRNRLMSVSENGPQAGGNGITTVSFNFSNYNVLTVSHPADVTVALRP